MVFNGTFNNISVISWRSVLLVEETRVPGENHLLPQVTDKLYHIMLYRAHLTCVGFELTTLVVIGTDCIGNCISNYHTITTTTAPQHLKSGKPQNHNHLLVKLIKAVKKYQHHCIQTNNLNIVVKCNCKIVLLFKKGGKHNDFKKINFYCYPTTVF